MRAASSTISPSCEPVAPIFLKYRDNLVRYIQSKVDDPDSRDDLLSEVMLKIYDQCERLDEVRNPEAWLLSIARNTVADYFRSKGKYEDASSLAQQVEDDVNLSEMIDVESCVHAMIGLLPEKYRGPLHDYEIKGIPQKELVGRYDLSESGVKSRVQRGRAMLKELFSQYCSEVTSEGCESSQCNEDC